MWTHIKIFNEFATDFELAQRISTGPITLVLAEGKIELQEVRFDQANKLHLGILSKFEIQHGLTSCRWASISGMIIKNFSQKETQ